MPESELLTVAEVADAAGLPQDVVRRGRRLLGLADPGDERVCSPLEVDLFRSLADAIAVFGEETPLQFVGLVGVTTQALAEAAQAMFSSVIAGPLLAAGESAERIEKEREDALAAFESARLAVDVGLQLHFARAGERFEGEVADDVEFAIGFVDLVRSTELAMSSDVRTYAAAVRDFEAAAQNVAAQHGVRLVKLIGDAAMLASRRAPDVVAAAASLVADIAADHRFEAARGGVAFGRVVARDGDYYGPAVNLAARLSGRAQPGAVLVDAAVARSVPDIVIDAGTQQLKGFSDAQRVFALRADG